MQETLFDISGVPVAYLDHNDFNTIYLWNGNPVSYIDDANRIYGFNGMHLGWFENGYVRNLQGMIVGYNRNACPVLTKLEPLKSLKKIKPLKSLKQLSRLKPIFSKTQASEYLTLFLSKGRN